MTRVVCEPGCTCKRHEGNSRNGRSYPCLEGCACGRHNKKHRGGRNKNYATGERHGSYTGESYRAAHVTLERLRGKAREHQCSHCDKWAREWAFLGKNGEFSTDVSQYIPLCVGCHRIMDNAKEALL